MNMNMKYALAAVRAYLRAGYPLDIIEQEMIHALLLVISNSTPDSSCSDMCCVFFANVKDLDNFWDGYRDVKTFVSKLDSLRQSKLNTGADQRA